MTLKKNKGRLILEEIKFDQMYRRNVHKGNERSGRVTLPVELVGKKVYVIVEPENDV